MLFTCGVLYPLWSDSPSAYQFDFLFPPYPLVCFYFGYQKTISRSAPFNLFSLCATRAKSYLESTPDNNFVARARKAGIFFWKSSPRTNAIGHFWGSVVNELLTIFYPESPRICVQRFLSSPRTDLLYYGILVYRCLCIYALQQQPCKENVLQGRAVATAAFH